MPRALPEALYVRNLQQTNIPSLAELLTQAPDDGTLYSFPNVPKYPEQMCSLHIGWLRQSIIDPTNLIRVAVIPNVEGSREKVVGFSSWIRRVNNPKTPGKTKLKEWQPKTWMDVINGYLMGLEETYNRHLSRSQPHPVLDPDPKRQSAAMKARFRIPSLTKTTPCYELSGLAVDPGFRGCVIAQLLVRWGMDRAVEEALPVFATGEETGVAFYEEALGFQRSPRSKYWLDGDAKQISRKEVEGGNVAWKKVNGGVSGCEVVWFPQGVVIDLNGRSV